MKKQILSIAMAAVMTMGAASGVSAAELQNTSQTVTSTQNSTTDVLAAVEADVAKSAQYLMSNLEQSIFAESYQMSYNDYQDAMYALKAGAENEKVTEKLNVALKEQLAGDMSTFLNPYGAAGVQSMSLAIAVLYLQEQGADVTAYEGINLLQKLEQTFLQEEEPNPYAYQYILAAFENAGEEKEAVEKKATEAVLGYFVSDETGTGINYWGVSADNNGQVLTALVKKYQTDTEIKDKVQAALDWNLSQKDESGAIVSWGSANASSTALALRAAAQFGRMEDAQVYYAAMKQFQSDLVQGAYTYAGEASIFSSRDALTGLLAYQNSLQGKSLFAVRYVKQEEEIPTPAPTPEPKQDGNTPAPNTNLPQQQSQETTAPSEQPAVTTAPPTGDDASTVLAAVWMAVAAAVACMAGSRRKKDYEDA